MYYYDQPQHFAPEVEDTIIGRVRGLLPKTYAASVRWEADVEKMEARDQAASTPPGGILFIGSSTVRMWKTDSAFSDLPVVNHGFGGSQIIDSVYYFDRLVTPLRPRQIVMYCGGNDLNAGKTPEQVCGDFVTFARLVREKLPQTKLTFIAIAPSVKRWPQIENQRATNSLIAAEIAKLDPKLAEFVPVEARLLDSAGQPQPSLHLKDMLHYNDAGYAILNDVIRPYLR